MKAVVMLFGILGGVDEKPFYHQEMMEHPLELHKALEPFGRYYNYEMAKNNRILTNEHISNFRPQIKALNAPWKVEQWEDEVFHRNYSWCLLENAFNEEWEHEKRMEAIYTLRHVIGYDNFDCGLMPDPLPRYKFDSTAWMK
jgi:hypothetical protein